LGYALVILRIRPRAVLRRMRDEERFFTGTTPTSYRTSRRNTLLSYLNF